MTTITITVKKNMQQVVMQSLTTMLEEMVEEYVMGLHYTDEAVKNFIEKIDSINKPITFVFYGDHFTWHLLGYKQ